MIPDALERAWFRWLAGSALPAGRFYPVPPPASARQCKHGTLDIEIVSHCWRYSRLLAYQLTSLVDHPVHDARVTMTVFHGAEDAETLALLEFFSGIEVTNVAWNFRELPKERLFRRAIGRNLAAKESDADWLWFTDCDLTFQASCLDSLAAALQGRNDALVYPAIESKTDAYGDAGSGAVGSRASNAIEVPALLRASPADFVPHRVTRATGPLQITHGEVARAVGYCDAVDYYQRPAPRWQKADEDRMFRWLLGTQGVPIDVDGVCRVQHVDKGRYRADGADAALRKRVRGWQDRRRKRA